MWNWRRGFAASMPTMFDLKKSAIAGVFAIQPVVRRDPRGCFVKTIYKEWFESVGLEADFVEQYYTVSHENVLRGMHFQIPPHDQYKLVTCLEGNVLDVVVDMRKGSPTYGHHACFELVGDQANSLYIAKGVAHGFYVKSRQATLLYNVSTYYAPMHDGGVRWDSVGVAWPCGSPLMSDRDRDLLTFPVFETPF